MNKEKGVIGIEYSDGSIEIIYCHEGNDFDRMKDVLSHYDMEKAILLMREGDHYYINPYIKDNKSFKEDDDSVEGDDVSIKLSSMQDLLIFFKQSICDNLFLLNGNNETWRYLHKDDLLLGTSEQNWKIFM
jgi:hypothetical protein